MNKFYSVINCVSLTIKSFVATRDIKWPSKQDVAMYKPSDWDFPSCSFLLNAWLLNLFLSFLADNRSHRKHQCGHSDPQLMRHCFFMSLSNFLEKTMGPKTVPVLKESQLPTLLY